MNNSNVSSTGHDTSPIVQLQLVYLGIVAILTIFGNILVIMAFAKGPRRIRTLTNYFVVNLAVSDLMVGCLSLPFWMCVLVGLKEAIQIGLYFMALDVLFGTTSILSLTLISVERMYAVKYPVKHYNLNARPVVCSIFMTWLFSFSVSMIAILLIKHNREVTTTVFVVAFALPLLIILASYRVIFLTAYNMMEADNKDNRFSRDIHIAKTISVIIGLFVVCWAPFFATNLAYAYCNECTKSWLPYVRVSKILHYSNSMMNVIVYAVRNPDFRETFKALLLSCDTTAVQDKLHTFSLSSLRISRVSFRTPSFTKYDQPSSSAKSLIQ